MENTLDWYRADWHFRPCGCWRTDFEKASIRVYDDLIWHVETSFVGQIHNGPIGMVVTVVAANKEPAPDLETAKADAYRAWLRFKAFRDEYTPRDEEFEVFEEGIIDSMRRNPHPWENWEEMDRNRKRSKYLPER